MTGSGLQIVELPEIGGCDPSLAAHLRAELAGVVPAACRIVVPLLRDAVAAAGAFRIDWREPAVEAAVLEWTWNAYDNPASVAAAAAARSDRTVTEMRIDGLDLLGPEQRYYTAAWAALPLLGAIAGRGRAASSPAAASASGPEPPVAPGPLEKLLVKGLGRVDVAAASAIGAAAAQASELKLELLLLEDAAAARALGEAIATAARRDAGGGALREVIIEDVKIEGRDAGLREVLDALALHWHHQLDPGAACLDCLIIDDAAAASVFEEEEAAAADDPSLPPAPPRIADVVEKLLIVCDPASSAPLRLRARTDALQLLSVEAAPALVAAPGLREIKINWLPEEDIESTLRNLLSPSSLEALPRLECVSLCVVAEVDSASDSDADDPDDQELDWAGAAKGVRDKVNTVLQNICVRLLVARSLRLVRPYYVGDLVPEFEVGGPRCERHAEKGWVEVYLPVFVQSIVNMRGFE